MRDGETLGQAIFTITVEGHDERNAPETTTVITYDASEGETLRYRVGRIQGGTNSGRPFDLETFPTPEAAEEYAQELAAASREQYRLEEAQRRETRAWALRDLVATWHRDDPAREVLEAVAAAIGQGAEGEVIEALAVSVPKQMVCN